MESPRRSLDSAFAKRAERETCGNSCLRGSLGRKSRYSKITL
jgi:hypothetical protein